ncbi:MAG: HAMP domain-containing histidine kinase, partial [Chitinophagaceae bacterium]|nr:HAMP domain-containing histidine kinase [Chitinophagaceae bacterium]
MKRTLPVIIILISLSLVGLILLQKSWLSNLLEVTESQLSHKIEDANTEVGKELAKNVYSGQLRLPRRNGINFNPDLHLHVLKPPTVAEKFSLQEIRTKLSNSFANQGLGSLKFEFAIINGSDDLEMSTKDFKTQFYDTVNYKRVYTAVVPEDPEEIEAVNVEKMIVMVPVYRTQVLASLRWVFIGAIGFTLIIIAAFYVTVKSLFDQRKLSEIKSDFINNMTHEFKTPLATISLAVDALRNEKVQQDKDKARYFSGIIKEENVRMNKHVETILQAALMERQELQLNLQPIHVHEIITDILDNYQLQLKDKQGEIILHLNAKNDLISADEVHFTNLISNLVDNAIKYSKEKPRVTIATHCTKKYLVIRVEDNGIGMNKETVKRIFEKFYRAHTGNLHDVKGFGLGMSYVKTVLDAH